MRLRKESSRTGKAAESTGLPLLETLSLKGLKTSETLFVLGSAKSINDISAERWNVIGKHDSVGINFWPVHSFVPSFFHFENISFDEQPVMYTAFLDLLKHRSDAYVNTPKIITEVHSDNPRQLLYELPEGIRKHLYLGFSMPVIARNEGELRVGIGYMRSIGVFLHRDRIAWLFKYGGSVIAMMMLAVVMGYKRIVLCGVDLNEQEYFYQDRERYPECAGWEFVSKKEMHLTTRRLPWLVPAQSAVWLFKELVLDVEGIDLFIENPVSTLYPRVPLVPQSLFQETSIASCQSL
jgi:hypothetical protein